MSKNAELLKSFVLYCEERPELRFWQALCNWAGVSFVHITPLGSDQPRDTFYFENKLS
jgi:hypothetical protein